FEGVDSDAARGSLTGVFTARLPRSRSASGARGRGPKGCGRKRGYFSDHDRVGRDGVGAPRGSKVRPLGDRERYSLPVRRPSRDRRARIASSAGARTIPNGPSRPIRLPDLGGRARGTSALSFTFDARFAKSDDASLTAVPATELRSIHGASLFDPFCHQRSVW